MKIKGHKEKVLRTTIIQHNTTKFENKLFENNDEISYEDLNNNHCLLKHTGDDSKLFIDYCLGKYDFNTIVKIFTNIRGYTDKDKEIWRSIIHYDMPSDYGMLPERSILSKEILQYLVLTEPCYHEEFTNNYKMNNIISIPKSLYLLHMFLQGNMKEIANENIDEQLNFFTLNPKPIIVIPLEYLEKFIQYNLTEYNFNDIDFVIETHQKILKKLR